MEAGKARLSELWKRKELEKLEVNRYLENKKEGKKELELFLPDGWMEWWRMINLDVEKQKNKKKFQQAEKAKKSGLAKPSPDRMAWMGEQDGGREQEGGERE